MAHDVFISYSAQDKPIADAICAVLEKHHIRCWIAPRDVLPGEDFPVAILNAISLAKLMVVVFSSNSNNSEHVSREVSQAVSKGIIVIPFRTENVFPTGLLSYYLSTKHWLDAYTPPVERHVEELARVVSNNLSIDTEIEPATEPEEVSHAKEEKKSNDEDVSQIVERYSNTILDEKIYFRPNIPQQKLANAIQNYAEGVKPESVLVLVDDTLRGDAKNGCLLTATSLYARGPLEAPKTIGLKYISSVSPKGKVFHHVDINGSEFLSWSSPSRKSCNLFCDMLEELVSMLNLNLDQMQSVASNQKQQDKKVADALRELKSLFDEGVITEEEYLNKHNRLLKQL